MFCPQCGAPNDEDSIYCGNCGAVLNPDAEPLEVSEQPVDRDPGAEPETKSVEEMLDVTPEEELVSYVPPPTSAPPAPSAPTSGMAIAALVLGISGVTVFPFLGSILALIFGYMARKEIRRRPDQLRGEGLAVGGIVTGWVGVGLMVLSIIGVGGLMLCGLCDLFGAGAGY
jgi:hypothetical protein